MKATHRETETDNDGKQIADSRVNIVNKAFCTDREEEKKNHHLRVSLTSPLMRGRRGTSSAVATVPGPRVLVTSSKIFC